MTNGLFLDLAVMIIIATFGAYLVKLLRQPMIPAYIITGLLIGPYGFHLVQNIENVKLFAEIGIAFLLFVVGLELELKRLKTIGFVASIGGILQIILTFFFAILLVVFLGFVGTDAVYLAIILAFSSTFVVIKMLSDRHELDTLHGRIMIGILLVQDVFAIMALSMLVTLSEFTPLTLLVALVSGAGIIALAMLSSRFIFPPIFKFAAKSRELLFLVAISVMLLFGMLSAWIGFSVAIGAFVAGLAIANLPYNFQIIGRITPLRDFFSTLFFVSLGMQLYWRALPSLWVPILAIIGFVIIFRTFLTLIICKMFGYVTKICFLSSISLAQISEFALIIATQGVLMGHIGQDIFSVTVVSAIITIAISSYFIHYDGSIYKKLKKPLKIFDRIGRIRHMEYMPKKKKYDVILIGCDRLGDGLLNTLKEAGKSVFVVDFNPDIVKKLINEKIPSMYGDVSDAEILERINLKEAEMIITTFPHLDTNIFLIKNIKKQNKKALIFVTANKINQALELYDIGADYVILPHFLGGTHVSLLLQESMEDVKKLLSAKLKHIKELHHRKKMGHEHPGKTRQSKKG